MNVSSNMNSSYHIYCIVFVGIPHINPQARIFIINAITKFDKRNSRGEDPVVDQNFCNNYK